MSDNDRTVAALIDGSGWLGPAGGARTGKLAPFLPDRQSQRGTEPANFEHAVLEYLFTHRKPLAVQTVLRARAFRVDGLIELEGKRRIAIEVKYRLNWAKATQALRQIEWFHTRPDIGSVAGGLVFFEEFSGDWARPISKAAPNSDLGWRLFAEEAEPTKSTHNLPVRAVRLRAGRLTTFDDETTVTSG